MSCKEKKPKQNFYASKHPCVIAMMKGLEKKNTFLGVNTTMNFKAMNFKAMIEGDALLIVTTKITARRDYVRFVPCKFCPWCGGDIYSLTTKNGLTADDVTTESAK